MLSTASLLAIVFISKFEEVLKEHNYDVKSVSYADIRPLLIGYFTEYVSDFYRKVLKGVGSVEAEE